jgi:hypothetical protein
MRCKLFSSATSVPTFYQVRFSPESPSARLLINEINANHESKRQAFAPFLVSSISRLIEERSSEGLQHNVVLIRELNANIAKVMLLYKSISSGSLTGVVRTLAG